MPDRPHAVLKYEKGLEKRADRGRPGFLQPWELALAEWRAYHPKQNVPQAEGLAKASELAGCDISKYDYANTLAKKAFRQAVRDFQTNHVRAARRGFKRLLPKAVRLYDKAMDWCEDPEKVGQARAAAALVAIAADRALPKKQETENRVTVMHVQITNTQQAIMDAPDIPEAEYEIIESEKVE